MMTKREAGRRGGLATVAKYGRGYMRELGRRGAAALYSRYDILPAGTSGWAMVEKATGKVKQIWS